MAEINLTESQKNEIIDSIKEDKPLPKKYIYKFFADDEDMTKQQSKRILIILTRPFFCIGIMKTLL